jgi:flagellar hook-length control protein FliK
MAPAAMRQGEGKPLAAALQQLLAAMPRERAPDTSTGTTAGPATLFAAAQGVAGAGVPTQGLPLAGAGSPMPRSDLTLPVPVGDPRWANALGERVLLMAGREQHVAELRLSPPNLGPLEVRLSLQQDQASVAFVAQHAAVRDALEQAIPRLREMLAQQDVQLVQVDVSQREAGGHPASPDGQAARSAAPGEAGDDALDLHAIELDGPGAGTGRGLVDLFA